MIIEREVESELKTRHESGDDEYDPLKYSVHHHPGNLHTGSWTGLKVVTGAPECD